MNTNFKTILVPTDFSEGSNVALEQGIVFAKLYNLEVLLLHVANLKNNSFALFSKKQPSKKDMINELTSRLKIISDEASQKSGVKINVMVEDGKEAKTIVRIADLFYSKYIIISYDKLSEAEKTTKISNLLDATDICRSQVITLNTNKVYEKINTIVLPLDITKESRQKVAHAVEFVKMFGSSIKLFSVLEGDDYQVNKLKSQTDSVAKFLSKSEIEYTTDLIKSKSSKDNIAHLLLEFVKENNGDMIIVMIHEDGESNNLSQYVIAHSEVPVVSVVARNIGSFTNF